MASRTATSAIIPLDRVQSRILIIRGQRVILAADLARLYAVPVKALNQAVRRNVDRFPDDFVFRLTRAEADNLSRSQFVTLNKPHKLPPSAATAGRGSNIKYLPYAFTEQGVAMAANVLRSTRAAKASVYVVRAFVKLRELLSTHVQLAHKLEELERRLHDHDEQILSIIDAIRELMEPPEEPPKPPIGFQTELAAPRKALHRGKDPL